MSYAIDATGQPLVLFGTADPDSSVYAINAITGQLVWRTATYNPPPGLFDVGAGVVVSPPGANGFADGAAYVENKDGIMYALDLTTGGGIWSYNFGAADGINPTGSLSTPALSGTDLITGTAGGIDELNAVTGALIWRHSTGDTLDVDSSPIITGPVEDRTVAYATMAGAVNVLSLATGNLLYSYQTGSFDVSSIADVDGNLIEASGDGYLYDFELGGGNTAPPTTTVTYPTDSSTLPNPVGDLTVKGRATGKSIGSVEVAFQKGGSGGTWWDSATGTWTAAPYPNPAALASPGAASSTWSLAVPIGSAGGGFEIFASAVESSGRADISPYQSPPSGGRVTFSVKPSPPPSISLSSDWAAEGQTLTVNGFGFADDEKVTLSFGGSYAKVATASATGSLTAVPVTIPDGTTFGPQTLVADGDTSGLSTTATFNVSNSWSQYLDTISHQADDEGDQAFLKRLSVGASSYLVPAWSFMSGAPVRTSVSMVDGVAYFGDDEGAVYAINIHSGTELWQYQDTGSKPIDSSPAVVGTDVIFGTGAGSVVDLNASNGKIRWVETFGHGKAVESSPAVADGIVYVGSDNDNVTALGESGKGSIVWQTALGGPVTSSPAVDTTAGLLFVGSGDGKISALSLSTGAVEWSVATSGPVTASPLILDGNVYVGSSDDTFYALNDMTGAKVWSYTTSGPITASASNRRGRRSHRLGQRQRILAGRSHWSSRIYHPPRWCHGRRQRCRLLCRGHPLRRRGHRLQAGGPGSQGLGGPRPERVGHHRLHRHGRQRRGLHQPSGRLGHLLHGAGQSTRLTLRPA